MRGNELVQDIKAATINGAHFTVFSPLPFISVPLVCARVVKDTIAILYQIRIQQDRVFRSASIKFLHKSELSFLQKPSKMETSELEGIVNSSKELYERSADIVCKRSVNLG